jgi:two-component system alkaline phosphatase synthesis response regulator PhoP
LAYQILVVDDEKTFRHFLALNLREYGYQVTEAADGQTALRLIEAKTFDVALIDLRLTDMNGLEVMRQLRQVAPQTSVIILTGYASVDSAIEALRQGAHDYVTKPFETADLLASVADGLARRTVTGPPAAEPAVADQKIFQVKELVLNRANRQVTRNGKIINLTPTEFDILVALISRPNVAIDAVSLIKEVRGYEASETDARAIARVHVHRLRHKVERDPAEPSYVMTVAGGRYLIKTD